MDQALTLAVRRPANAPACAPKTVSLIVENMKCGGCMGRIERALRATPGVSAARANLAAKRVAVTFDEAATEPLQLIEALDRSGYRAAELVADADDEHGRARRRSPAALGRRRLRRRQRHAAFGVGVGRRRRRDMDQSATDLFHWLSALIAMPAIAYAGQPFFRSA